MRRIQYVDSGQLTFSACVSMEGIDGSVVRFESMNCWPDVVICARFDKSGILGG